MKDRHLRIQQPITLPPDDEPEPDATIALARPGNYRERHPLPGEITCPIEVADSSLQRDRATRQRIYADHGIPQSLIINLADGVIEEHRDPRPGTGRYATINTVYRDGSVGIDVGKDQHLDVPAATLLP